MGREQQPGANYEKRTEVVFERACHNICAGYQQRSAIAKSVARGLCPRHQESASSDETSADSKDQAKTDAPADAKAADPSKADPKANGSGEKKPDAQIKPGQSAEDRQKALDAWQKKLDGQKDKISLASRELDVLQREYQLKVSEFYSDAAHRVQNPNALFDDDAKYKQQIADKQKTLDDAKSQLNDMQEEARRSGAPSSVTE